MEVCNSGIMRLSPFCRRTSSICLATKSVIGIDWGRSHNLSTVSFDLFSLIYLFIKLLIEFKIRQFPRYILIKAVHVWGTFIQWRTCTSFWNKRWISGLDPFCSNIISTLHMFHLKNWPLIGLSIRSYQFLKLYDEKKTRTSEIFAIWFCIHSEWNEVRKPSLEKAG